jgi:glucose/arabinose dehydrogenase
MRIHRRALAGLVLAGTAACQPSASSPRATAVPPAIAAGVTLTRVASGLAQPVALAFAPGDPSGRLFVVEKTGTIRIMRNGVVDPKGTPFLDWSAEVSQGSEQGLLGLAFHPQFAENGRFFVNLTDRKGDTRLHEFYVPPPRTDLEHAVPVRHGDFWVVDQPYSNHNGGNLVFGPDGLLYVGLGDGGAAGDPKGNGQNPTTHLGKMLALNVDAGVPPRLIALGLRNPWRYSFDRKTGDLWIGDVGQSHFEEVDVLTPAMRAAETPTNFGWNRTEGLHCYPAAAACDRARYTDPVIEYDHGDGCAITGGFVYRGRALPALDGLYFYADYCSAMIRSLRWHSPGKPVTDVWDWREALDPEGRLASLSSFGEDAAGELYLLSLDGSVYRFDPAPTASGRPSP